MTPKRTDKKAAWRSVLTVAALFGGLAAAQQGGVGFGIDSALAQSDGSRAAEDRETKQVQAASKDVYEALNEAQKLMDKEDYDAALEVVNEVAEDMEDRSSYDRVLINQLYGYIYSSQEQYGRAIKYFEAMVAEEEIPPGLRNDTLYNLGQLYMIEERYQESIETLRRWFKVAKNPQPNGYFLLAQAHMQQEDYKAALEPAEQGMEVAKANLARDRKAAKKKPKVEAPDPIRENWYQILLSLYFQTNQYEDAIGILRELLNLYPKRDYWLQLQSAFFELGREWDQLGAMEAAYRQDLLIRSGEYENLAQLYMYHNIPIKGVWVMEDGMERGIVEGNADTWELLANAYYNAKETEESVEPLRRAAKLTEDGNLYVRLGQSLMDLAQWDAAATAFQNALDKGGLDSTGQAYLLMGMSHFNDDDFEEARQAFRNARDHQGTEQSANQWLNYLSNEEKRRKLGGLQ